MPALKKLGAIMAAPDCPDNNWMTTRSENVMLELMDDIEKAYPIDPQRRLITGYSIGAKGIWFMSAKHQERFSAAIPISTTPPEGVVQASWGIPLYVIHSRDDELFPLESTNLVVEQLQSRGVRIELVVVERVTHFDVTGFIEPLRDAVPWIEKQWTSA
jgi:predicted peptidase